jgi:hypothetical protein
MLQVEESAECCARHEQTPADPDRGDFARRNALIGRTPRNAEEPRSLSDRVGQALRHVPQSIGAPRSVNTVLLLSAQFYRNMSGTLTIYEVSFVIG